MHCFSKTFLVNQTQPIIWLIREACDLALKHPFTRDDYANQKEWESKHVYGAWPASPSESGAWFIPMHTHLGARLCIVPRELYFLGCLGNHAKPYHVSEFQGQLLMKSTTLPLLRKQTNPIVRGIGSVIVCKETSVMRFRVPLGCVDETFSVELPQTH